MKLAVFASLLVVLTAQAVSASCIGKTVEVYVANGQGLTGDGLGRPDPYVKVTIGEKTNRTSTIDDDSNPVWGETFKVRSASSNLLEIEVWEEDSGLFGGDDHLGTCKEKLGPKMKLAVFASLLVVLTAQAVSASCIGKTVEVYVANGQGLTGDGLGYPDPYVKVSIGEKTHRTRTIADNSNPVWEETFKVRSASSNRLIVEVWEEDSGLFGGDDHLGTCEEILGTEEGCGGNRYCTLECRMDQGHVKVLYKCLTAV
ncbi:hypothetical protein INR49_014894 [Caranx melampygus]|nr:hypothetical protein INR49_014894 [Caranx melampygus]